MTYAELQRAANAIEAKTVRWVCRSCGREYRVIGTLEQACDCGDTLRPLRGGRPVSDGKL